MTTWKDVERRIARLLGGERTGCRGVPSPDVITPWLIVEVKHRDRLPKWLMEAYGQVKKHSRRYPNHLPVLVLHQKGAHDSLVLMSLRDFCEWFVG